MRYRGTDIDGVELDPDRLEVRGTPVAAMIGTLSLAQGIAHVTALPLDANRVEAALCAGIGGLDAVHPATRIAGMAAASGAGMARSVMAGLAGLGPADTARVAAEMGEGPAGLAEGLAVTAAIPALIGAWRAQRPKAPVAPGPSATGGFVARARAACADGPAPGAAELALFEDVMVAWLGGFGYLPPSVMIPRLAIGTGVPVVQALAAGFGAAGPNHIGATEQATALLLMALAGDPGTDPAQRMAAVLESVTARGQRVGGFGHPLLLADPRPPRLRARAAELGLTHPVLALYDTAVAQMQASHGLAPNIDFATGMVAVAAGLTDPAAASGLAMTARSIGMLAHVLERRDRPAFGVTRSTARAHLHSLPTGWL